MEKVAADWSKILSSKDTAAKLCRIEREYPDIKNHLEAIYQAYISDSKQEQLNDVREALRIEFQGKPYIYRYTSRIKNPNSLLVKIIGKIYESSQKYSGINVSNYDKLLTDLFALRLVHRFKDEWVDINQMIYESFFRGDNFFIDDYVAEYMKDCDIAFLIEKPIIYHLPNEDLSMYQNVEKAMGRSLFSYIPRKNYRSVHYLVNYRGVYVEIQVRTLGDDLWNDIEHDLVYKQEISVLRDKLSFSADLLRTLLSAVDDVGMHMKLLADGQKDTANIYMRMCSDEIDRANQKIYNLKGEKRNVDGKL